MNNPEIKPQVKRGRPRKGEGRRNEVHYRSAVLHLNKEDKKKLEKIAKAKEISFAQLLTFGAMKALMMDIPTRVVLEETLQIRLPGHVHKQLKAKSERTGLPMTELMMIGLEAELGPWYEGE